MEKTEKTTNCTAHYTVQQQFTEYKEELCKLKEELRSMKKILEEEEQLLKKANANLQEAKQRAEFWEAEAAETEQELHDQERTNEFLRGKVMVYEDVVQKLFDVK